MLGVLAPIPLNTIGLVTTVLDSVSLIRTDPRLGNMAHPLLDDDEDTVEVLGKLLRGGGEGMSVVGGRVMDSVQDGVRVVRAHTDREPRRGARDRG